MTTAVDRLVAETSARKGVGTLKADKGPGKATLTPVGTERKAPVGVPDVPEVFLTNEAIKDIANDLRRQAAVLLEAADGLDRLTGVAEAAQPDMELEKKLFEREADRRAADRAAAEAGDKRAERRVAEASPLPDFEEHWKRISAEAQASAFGGDLVPAAREVFGDDIIEPAQSGSAKPGWVCPTHGDEAIRGMTSKSGRAFRLCTICRQFEKGTE